MNEKKTITILLPGRLDRPVGGHKIIYQYANLFAKDGFKVVIANNIFSPANSCKIKELLRQIYALLRFCVRALRGQNTCSSWFSLDKRIEEKQVWTFDSSTIESSDYYIATAAITAPFLSHFNVPEEQKIYFIQDYENWQLDDKQLRETYKIASKKIVVSNWLSNILDEEGVNCTVVKNGFITEEFVLTIPIEQKDRCSVSMLFHTDRRKNSSLGIEAINIVKSKFPQLKVSLFGVYDCPPDLPSGFSYYKAPTIEEHNFINNHSAIYIGTSTIEGFGLTIGEAMLCGQAVACTDASGYLEMAINGVTALVSPKNDAQALANNIIRLINDDELRFAIAHNAYSYVCDMTVEKSYSLFKSILLK